jgi:alkaline phosphatase
VACAGQAGGQTATAPRNVVLFIGDGMGFEHVKAAGLYANGKPGSTFMETLPYRAEVATASASTLEARGRVVPTDSAAAATAMATGVKVHNGVLSMAIPGDGRPLKTVLEHFTAQGRMTGLVTTAYITDATPAAFGAHAKSRHSRAEIVDGYLRTVRPNVIMGGGDSDPSSGLTPAAIKAAGYELVTERGELANLKASAGNHVFSLFGSGNLPYEVDKAKSTASNAVKGMSSLSQMAAAAMRIVTAAPRGFFIMIEGGMIDKAAHAGELERSLMETVEFDRTVKLVMDWASGRTDTLVLVSADHETNGLQVIKGNGRGRLPDVQWTGNGGHTDLRVPLFAWGVGTERVSRVLDNTTLFRLMMGTMDIP